MTLVHSQCIIKGCVCSGGFGGGGGGGGGGWGGDKGEVVESVGRKRAGKNFVGVYVGGGEGLR